MGNLFYSRRFSFQWVEDLINLGNLVSEAKFGEGVVHEVL